MQTSLFDFELPESLIAAEPVRPRDAARLLAVGDALEDAGVRDLPRFLQPGDLLVFNDTKVIPARLLGKRGEAKIELLLHRPMTDSPMNTDWECFAKPAKRLQPNDSIRFADGFETKVLKKLPDGQVAVRFNAFGEAFREFLQAHGQMPLPPYMRRPAQAHDAQDYQTVYAKHEGSVAAPTAGLHFTPELLAALRGRGVETAFVTLHVGAGTFLPVKVDDTAQHVMHRERYVMTPETAAAIARTKAAGGRVVAVGTTSLRVLESCGGKAGEGETQLFITPGYEFKVVDVLMTNFHLPRSTLFMLVSAFAGLERMKAAYAHAMAEKYRFYSYGDACLLFKPN